MTTIIKGLLLATTIVAAFIIVSCEKNMEEPATADSEVVSSTINSTSSRWIMRKRYSRIILTNLTSI